MVRAPANNKGSHQSHRHGHGDRDKGKVNGRFGQRGDDRRGNRNRGGKSQMGEQVNLTPPDWSSIKLSSFKKDFYEPHEIVLNRSKHEVEEYHAEHGITLRGKVPNPIMNFNEVNIPNYVLNEIKKQGYEKPTPIQAQGWPIALSGSNMVGIAKTGSGKTLGKFFF